MYKLFTAFVLVLVACTTEPSSKQEKAAVASATAWLQLVDNAQYAQSWSQAASLFRKAVPSSTWENQIRAVRGPLGPVASRVLASIDYTTTLPGAPDGQYVVLQYETSYSNKKNAIETITPMREPDGSWRVSGYFIK